MFGSQRKKQEG